MSQPHASIGFDEWQEEHISDLAYEFYGRQEPDPDDLFYSDPSFKHYVYLEWDNVCDATNAKYE